MADQKIIDKYLKEFHEVQKMKVPIELNIYLHRMIDESLSQPRVSDSLPKTTTIWKKAREMEFAYFRKWWLSRVGNDR
jgi:hypothetical protein